MTTSVETNTEMLTLTQSEVLERASKLVPSFRQRAAWTEANGKVAPKNVDELIRSGIVRAFAPRRYGGGGLERDVALEAVMEVSRGCGSTGWCTSIWLLHAWMMCFCPEEFQDVFFAGGPDVLCTHTGGANWSRIEPVSGGYTVSGVWSFGSGCDYSTEHVIIAPLPEGPAWMAVRDKVKIVENWDVLGLRGTGSKDLLVENLFVPDNRVFPVARLNAPPWLGYELHGLASLRVPHYFVLGAAIAAPAVGIAQSAVDEFITRLAGRSGPGRTADAVANQLRVAEAQVATDAAHLLLAQEMKDLIAGGADGCEFTPFDRARYRTRHAFVAELCSRAVTTLFQASGAHSLYAPDPMPRLFRDVTASGQHAANTWDTSAAEYGCGLLNRAPGSRDARRA